MATNSMNLDVARGPASPEADGPDLAVHMQDAMEKLSECLTTELTALERYDLALKHALNPRVSQKLLQLRGDHARRAELLRNRIKDRRTTPGESTDATVALAEVVAASAGPLEEAASITALEELERRGVELYRDGVALVDLSTRAFFETVLLPAQQRTQDLCRSLRGYIRQPGLDSWEDEGGRTWREMPIGTTSMPATAGPHS